MIRKLYIYAFIVILIIPLSILSTPLYEKPVSNSTMLRVANAQQPLGKLGMIIILDALNVSTLQLADTPNLDNLINEGIAFLNAETVLPSATTSAHVAMVTGAPPEINGVVHTYAYNASEYHELLPDETPVSYGYMDMLRAKTLPEAAKEAGVKVGIIVSKYKLRVMAGKTQAADKLLILPSEIVGGDPHEADYPFEKRLEITEWITNATISTIDEFYQYILSGESALIITHYAEPDYIQGALGTRHPDTIRLIEFLDSEIGRIISELKRLNLWQRTFLVVAADHGFTDVDINKNLLAADVSHLGAITVEHIIAETAGLLLNIYLKNPDEIADAVSALKDQPWVKSIWTRYPVDSANGTLKNVGLDIDYAGDIVLDIKPPYYASRYFSVGCHGGTATKVIPIIFAGGLLKKTTVSETPTILHIGPTLAALYGLSLPNATVEPLDIIAPTAEVSMKIEPGIAEPDISVSVEINYTILGDVANAKAKLFVYDSNGTLAYSDEKALVTISGSVAFEISLSAEDTYTIHCEIVDEEGNILGGKVGTLLVIAVEKPRFPIEKVVGSFVIVIALSAILIAIPVITKRKKKI